MLLDTKWTPIRISIVCIPRSRYIQFPLHPNEPPIYNPILYSFPLGSTNRSVNITDLPGCPVVMLEFLMTSQLTPPCSRTTEWPNRPRWYRRVFMFTFATDTRLMSLVTPKKVRRRTREKCHLAVIGKYFPVTGCYILPNIFSVLQKEETSEMLCASASLPWDSGWTFICQWVALLLLFGLAVKVSAEGDGLVHEHEVGGSCCRVPVLHASLRIPNAATA